MTDSDMTEFDADNTNTQGMFAPPEQSLMAETMSSATLTFSVWDEWELVEEYGSDNVRTAAYLQGAHGPVKSLMAEIIYFYQDSLGSTSHIANASGALLESYRYDLYGKPTYWNAGGTQISASAHGVVDLFSGERWVSEAGLYDLRNRFYSPDLGRFLQPDPIGFKGDASNLYRYCGNDWANRTDPMGLTGTPNDPRVPEYDPNQIPGTGNGQWSKMQSMGASQISQRMQAHSIEVARAEANRSLEAAAALSLKTGVAPSNHGSLRDQHIQVDPNGSTVQSAGGKPITQGTAVYYVDGKAVASYPVNSGGWGKGRTLSGHYVGKNLRTRYDRTGMIRDGVGFSLDLNPLFQTDRTLLRMHPDGPPRGSEGCIALSCGAAGLRDFQSRVGSYLKESPFIDVYVGY